MRFDPMRFTLKDGRAAVLRVPEPDDAPQMLDYLVRSAEESDFLLRLPEECDYTEEQERTLLAQFRDNPDSLMLACFVDGSLAGNCNLAFSSKRKIRHRADVAIAVRRDFWGLGIGTAMFRAMIDLARARGVAQIELEYIEGNDRARALYEKLGFVVYAEHPDAIRQRDGSLKKLICMMKKL